jgi:putative tricarboxylic transport membrane protein
MLEHFFIMFNFIVDPINALIVVAGVVLGIIIGALPGLGVQAGIAILIPVTLWMTPAQAIAMLSAVYAAGVTGGSITSILFRIPGESSSAMTIFDGYPMAKQGKADRALGIAMTASAIGGCFSAIVLMTISPQLAKIALKFDQAEYFAICIFGISAVTSLGSKNQLKALVSLLIGLFVVTIGVSEVGEERFTFGSERLRYGISYVPVIVGLFGFPEFLRNTATIVFRKAEFKITSTKVQLGVIRDFLHMKGTVIRSILIGTFVGILPGTGSTAASILAYNEAVRWSKHPEQFGTGIDEGVAAPEFADNAATGGALVPTLTLGIPGSSTCAVILAAFMSHGIVPGPNLFIFNNDMVWGIFAGFFLANVIMIFFGLLGIWMFSKVLSIPLPILNWIIFLLCVVGAFGINNNLIDVWIMFISGLFGYIMEKYEFPLTPLVLGIILGPMIEKALITGMIIYGSFWPFMTRPLGGTLLGLAILFAFVPTIRSIVAHRKARTPA